MVPKGDIAFNQETVDATNDLEPHWVLEILLLLRCANYFL